MGSTTGYATTIGSARRELTRTVKRFREEGATAEPVVFGSHRRPEAVLLPFEAYEALLEIAEDAAIAKKVRERASADTGGRLTLQESAEELGVDLSEL